MLRIGTFARIAGVSAKALRDYDEIGLFRPAWVDPATGYRGYSPAQLPQLRRILALRSMGIGLAEIGRLVSGGADLGDVLERRRSDLERERREIDRRLAALDIQVEMSGGSGQPDVVVRPVEADSIATLAEPTDLGLEAAFYALEAVVRDLGIRARRPPGALVADGRAEAFVPVRQPTVPDPRIAYRRLPAVRAATVVHHGSYATIRATRAALERWVDTAGFRPTGPLRVLYLQFGGEPELALPPDYLVDRDADFVTELQLPVES
jgi:DNA-binding transcriptional MerR regulator